ncbi:hypothetical protein LY78DRAFT_441763 [Colletotrichum sublineola]|nr:hypothetical protein LY78DRAFT_441763 [Colletotrichum sublineola]
MPVGLFAEWILLHFHGYPHALGLLLTSSRLWKSVLALPQRVYWLSQPVARVVQHVLKISGHLGSSSLSSLSGLGLHQVSAPIGYGWKPRLTAIVQSYTSIHPSAVVSDARAQISRGKSECGRLGC